MKKILVILLISVLAIGLIGCGGGNKKSSSEGAAAGSAAAGDASYDKLIDDFEVVVNGYLDLMDAYYADFNDAHWDAAEKLQEDNKELYDKLYNAYEGNKLSDAQRQRFSSLFDQY